ncbi:MAG: ABC transporter permease subunit [Geminicoccaceae bacterium]
MAHRRAIGVPGSWAGFEAGLVVALLGWLVLQGALALDYRWQWYRVWPYLVVADARGLRAGPLLQGLLVTLALCGWSFLGMLACGIAAAVLQLVPSFTGRLLARAYVELVRNTPLLVQLYLLYFVAAPSCASTSSWRAWWRYSLFEGLCRRDRARRHPRRAGLANARPPWRWVSRPGCAGGK